MGLDFYYEPEVFEFYNLRKVNYLPDFRIFLPGLPARWIEVKGPELYLEANEKASALALHTGELVQIWQGSWGSQTIYSYVRVDDHLKEVSDVIRISSKQLDSGFEIWTKDELKDAYEQARQI